MIFNDFLMIFFKLKSRKKWGLFSAEPADDTWRAELMWHTGPTQMRRSTEATWQGRAWPTPGAGGAWVVRTHGRRPRESTRTSVRGATWQSEGWHLEGPRVSGSSLGVWRGNANALPRPSFYTHDFLFFIPCGTMFHELSLLQATWQHHGRQIRSRGVDRVDPSPRDRN